jgi:hypothetical protein
MITVIKGAEKEVAAVISELNLYNLEPIQKSVFVTAYELAQEEGGFSGSLADFITSSPELSPALSKPICKYQDNIFSASELNESDLGKVLNDRTEIDLGKFQLDKGDEFNLEVLDNEFFNLEAAYLAEEYSLSQKEPQLTFKRINPTRYIVDVRAWGPFWLILNENYHSGWKAYIIKDNSAFAGEEEYALEFAYKNRDNLILITEHDVINAYANGWFVPADKVLESTDSPYEFRIVLEFCPQRLYEAGMIISGLAFAVMVLILIIYGIKRLKNK